MESPTFIPPTKTVEAMTRDLRFHPSTTVDPRQLSREQIEFFNREGYLAPIPLFGQEEIADIRSYFDELLARTLAAGGSSYSISHRAPEPWARLRLIDRRADCFLCKGPAWRECDRMGFALLLQDARRRETRVLASGC